MESSPNNEFDQNKTKPGNEVVPEESPDQSMSLSGDPDYEKLIEHFQKGEKDLAKMVLNTLEKRYPSHPELQIIKDELKMKVSVKNLAEKIEKGERQKNRKEFLNLTLFAVIGTILVMVAFYFTSQFLLQGTLEEQVDQSEDQLNALQSQVEQLLIRGRPQPAAEILETMRGINPDWEALSELTLRTETLLQLEEDYNQALELAEQGENVEALALFQSIEEAQPGLWDVRSQIEAMEAKTQINIYLEQGAAAFQAGDWIGVINAYESALVLDPSMEVSRLKQQLIQAYLNEISALIENENPPLETIEIVEDYYRSAMALIPQGGEFSAQRAQLDELNNDIKELKYIRMAKDILSNPLQTTGMIGNAISYMRQASNLNPRNGTLQVELQIAQIYRDGFQNFVAMSWEPAIQNFNQILSSDSSFLQGQAKVLLYESYYGLGKQLSSIGQYGNAITALEAAESLAFEDNDNLIKLFQVQILKGNVLWQNGEPEAAFIAYQGASNNINLSVRLEGNPEILQNYIAAINSAADESYDNAYQNIQIVFGNINLIYTYSEVTVSDGASLAFIANNNNSTIDAINQENGLPNDVVVAFGGTLQVPSIEN